MATNLFSAVLNSHHGVWYFVVIGAALLVLIPIALVASWTCVLAGITWWRLPTHDTRKFKSCLCSGRVSHTRLQPVVHGFSYPLFFAAVDLQEVQDLFHTNSRKGLLWPLNQIMSFQTCDHLKNREGLGGEQQQEDVSLMDRVFRLIAQKTQNKFRPTRTTHSVVLLTHLRYFGYCFNPVSFYYVLDASTKKCECIIGEVSNTPWNEMQCYVLHPDSIDATSFENNNGKTNIVFPKTFHVSPFMEMDHVYYWTFDEKLDITKSNTITVNTTMKKQDESYFSASFSIQPMTPLANPWLCALTLLKYPLYCVVIQVWIHYEAIWLFAKGVSFIPHPQGSETRASRWIGNIMAPVFAVKAWIQQGSDAEVGSKEKAS